jgi:hypothetical protein
MKKINKIYVNNKKMLDALYNDSALTIEGLSEESINDFIEWIENYTSFKNDKICYIIKGSIMNKEYHLTGDNRYNDNLTIVSVMLSDLKEPLTLAIPRMGIARWFDDIVEDNRFREIGEYFND